MRPHFCKAARRAYLPNPEESHGAGAARLVFSTAVGSVVLVQMATQIAGALDVAVGRVEPGVTQFLQVSRLRVDEELIERGNAQIGNQTQVNSHAHAGKQ